MVKTRKISLLKKKVANKKKRNTYKRIKIKRAFRNKKKGGNVIKCTLLSRRKSVKVLSKELYEIGKIDDIYAVNKKEHAIEVLKKLKDHYKQNSRTLPCECSLIKEGDPNNDEKFSTKNDCENAKLQYYKNLKSAFFETLKFVISKYEKPQAIGKQSKEEVEKEKDKLQTIIDEIEKKIADHDEKIEERMPVDEIPKPTGSNLSKLAELQKELAAKTRKNRRDYQEKDSNYRLKQHLNAVKKDRALDTHNSKKPDTKYSIDENELASLSDVQGDMEKIKALDETSKTK